MSSLSTYQTVSTGGTVTHVIVPVADYERLTGEHPSSLTPPSDEIVRAAMEIYKDPKTTWHDAGSVFRSLLTDGIAGVRQSLGLSQAELGERAGVSQSKISRCEQDPEGVSVRMLKRIAEALSRGA